MNVVWKGSSINMQEFYNNNYITEVDKKYLKPTEVDSILSDANKAKQKLGWKLKYSFFDLVREMTLKDYDDLKK